MIHPSKSYPFDDSHLQQINSAMKMIAEAREIAKRCQKAGMPTEQAIADCDFLEGHFQGIKDEFFTPKAGQ